MKIKTQNYGEVTVVQLQGDLDLDSAEFFKTNVTDIIAADRSSIVIDMSEVGSIDSVGLEHLLWARDSCDQNKCQVRLAGLDDTCKKILEVTRLEDEFDCYDELAGAVKSFA